MTKGKPDPLLATDLLISRLEDIQWDLKLTLISGSIAKADGFKVWNYYKSRVERNMKTIDYMGKIVANVFMSD